MNLERVYEFITIADSPSMRHAAAVLNISIQTLSARMKGFEEELGVSLFSREFHSLTLSPEGERFLVDAREIHAEYSGILTQLQQLERFSTSDCLRIALAGACMPPHLGPFMDLYTRQHPNLQIMFFDDTTYSIQESIAQDHIDLYFSPAPVLTRYEVLAKYTISACHPRVFLPKEHPLATKPNVTLEDLNQETFLLYPPTKVSFIRDFQLECLEHAHIQYSICQDTYTASLYSYLIPMGKGLFITPFLTEDTPPHCVSLPLRQLTHKLSYCVFYAKKNTPTKVLDFLQEYKIFATPQERSTR